MQEYASSLENRVILNDCDGTLSSQDSIRDFIKSKSSRRQD